MQGGTVITGGILALDIATTTGWVHGRIPAQALTRLEAHAQKPPQPASGVIVVQSKMGVGHFLSEFEETIAAMLHERRPAGLVIEQPILPQAANFHTVRKLMSMCGSAEKLGAQYGIRWVRIVQPSSVKKHFTGNGRAKKPDMMAECDARGWTYRTDDEADALGIWDLGCELFRQECGR